MSKPVMKAILRSPPTTLALISVLAACVVAFFEPIVAAFVLIGGGLTAVVWRLSPYRRMTVTIHRKWRSSPQSHGRREKFYLASYEGEAIVTKSLYDRVKEGSSIVVIARAADGHLDVIWPLF